MEKETASGMTFLFDSFFINRIQVASRELFDDTNQAFLQKTQNNKHEMQLLLF